MEIPKLKPFWKNTFSLKRCVLISNTGLGSSVAGKPLEMGGWGGGGGGTFIAKLASVRASRGHCPDLETSLHSENRDIAGLCTRSPWLVFWEALLLPSHGPSPPAPCQDLTPLLQPGSPGLRNLSWSTEGTPALPWRSRDADVVKMAPDSGKWEPLSGPGRLGKAS